MHKFDEKVTSKVNTELSRKIPILLDSVPSSLYLEFSKIANLSNCRASYLLERLMDSWLEIKSEASDEVRPMIIEADPDQFQKLASYCKCESVKPESKLIELMLHFIVVISAMKADHGESTEKYELWADDMRQDAQVPGVE